MVQSKPSDNVNTNSLMFRFEQASAGWLKAHTPAWLWKTILFHPDGLLSAKTPEEARQAKNFSDVLIYVALLILLISLLWQ